MKQTWRQRLSLSWLSIVRASRPADQRAHQLAAQGLHQARAAGAALARKIISIQQAAGLDPRIIRESARAVASRHLVCDSDRQWQTAYIEAAARAVPGLVLPQPQPASPPPPAPPSWPYKGGSTDPIRMQASDQAIVNSNLPGIRHAALPSLNALPHAGPVDALELGAPLFIDASRRSRPFPVSSMEWSSDGCIAARPGLTISTT